MLPTGQRHPTLLQEPTLFLLSVSLSIPIPPPELSIPLWRRRAQTPSPSPHLDAQAVHASSATRSIALSGSFRPMESVKGVGFNYTAEKVRTGFSWKYKGDIRNPKNCSLGISEDQNCAVFLTNLPRGITEKILLDALGIHAPFGRVFATSVTQPEDLRHATACGKVVMFDRESAVALYNFVHAGRLIISGRTINVIWNINRSPVQKLPEVTSRVLEILGPLEVVNIHRLCQYLYDQDYLPNPRNHNRPRGY